MVDSVTISRSSGLIMQNLVAVCYSLPCGVCRTFQKFRGGSLLGPRALGIEIVHGPTPLKRRSTTHVHTEFGRSMGQAVWAYLRLVVKFTMRMRTVT